MHMKCGQSCALERYYSNLPNKVARYAHRLELQLDCYHSPIHVMEKNKIVNLEFPTKDQLPRLPYHEELTPHQIKLLTLSEEAAEVSKWEAAKHHWLQFCDTLQKE